MMVSYIGQHNSDRRGVTLVHLGRILSAEVLSERLQSWMGCVLAVPVPWKRDASVRYLCGGLATH